MDRHPRVLRPRTAAEDDPEGLSFGYALPASHSGLTATLQAVVLTPTLTAGFGLSEAYRIQVL